MQGQILDLTKFTFRTPKHTKKGKSSELREADNVGISLPSTSVTTDASHWRRLPPFADIDDDEEVARIMLSRGRLANVMRDYIFMRWKDCCFIPQRQSKHGDSHLTDNVGVASQEPIPTSFERAYFPAPRGRDHSGSVRPSDATGHELSISGFYYVSLCRATGRIEALYNDPGANPYQRLTLESTNAGHVGVREMR